MRRTGRGVDGGWASGWAADWARQSRRWRQAGETQNKEVTFHLLNLIYRTTCIGPYTGLMFQVTLAARVPSC